MYPEGDVYPCEILDDSHKIGNIRDFDLNFKKLWLSHKAKEDIKFIRKTRCFCTHECFNSVNIFFNPKFYPKIIKKYKML
jgi:radical SAM protein with 4Fe4S-binding SPASM domain